MTGVVGLTNAQLGAQSERFRPPRSPTLGERLDAPAEKLKPGGIRPTRQGHDLVTDVRPHAELDKGGKQ